MRLRKKLKPLFLHLAALDESNDFSTTQQRLPAITIQFLSKQSTILCTMINRPEIGQPQSAPPQLATSNHGTPSVMMIMAKSARYLRKLIKVLYLYLGSEMVLRISGLNFGTMSYPVGEWQCFHLIVFKMF
jgi:hypothetical protein